MGNTPTNIANQLTEMRETFVEGLRDRLHQLDLAAQPLSATTNESDVKSAVEQINGLAHRLAGAAGTFGFATLSDAAVVLAEQAMAAMKEQGALSDAQHQALKIALENVAVTGTSCTVQSVADVSAWEIVLAEQAMESGTRKTILLVEDDDAFAALLRTQLSYFGYDVEHLAAPARLRETVAAISPAAIIMDIVFPDGEDAGLSAVRTLKDAGEISCPVVFSSVREDLNARLGAVRAGGDGYLVKPLDLIQLVDTLTRLTAEVAEAPYRILIVDDDPIVAEFHATVLEQAGMETTIVTNPLKVMAPLRALQPDAILMDVAMPECNGFELAKALRQDRDNAQIPIIFLTAENDHDKHLSAMLSGGDDFLEKSNEPAFLIASVRARAQRARDMDLMMSRLRESETRLRALSDSANDAIISIDQEGRIVFWNRGAEKIFGYTGVEILGTLSADLLVGDERAPYLKNLKKFQDGLPFPLEGKSLETTGLRKNGQSFPAEISITGWSAGDRNYLTGFVRDITERKRVEKELRDSEERLAAAVENLSDGFVMCDGDDRIVLLNTKFRHLYPNSLDLIRPGANFADLIRAGAERG